MKAVILAAGMGKRMQAYSKGAPKCLVPIGKETLLSREIRQLKELGFKQEDILVVGGYKHEMLVNCGAKLIVNSEYERTDNSYTLGLALQQIEDDDVIIMDSDLVFDRAILEAIIEQPHSNVIATKKMSDLQESTGIVMREDLTVSAIGKQHRESGYVYISIFKVGKEVLRDFRDALFEVESVKTWYTRALTEVMQKYPFYNYIASDRWHEVDFPEDYFETLEMFGIEGAVNE